MRDEGLAAVHLGFHHGIGGVVLALSRAPALAGAGRPRAAGYLSAAARLRARERVAGRLERTALEAGHLDRMHLAGRPQAGALARLARLILAAAAVYSFWFRPPRQDNRRHGRSDGLPRLRQVGSGRQDLCAAADHGRQPRRWPADARLGRRRPRPDHRLHGPSGRSCTTWARMPAGSPLLDEALSLAERLAEDASTGRVDLADLGRRARKLLESSSRPPEGAALLA